MTDELQRKVDRAIKLIQAAGNIAQEHGQPLEICYSGGKDSDVILELARMAGIKYRAIYKNTTIEVDGQTFTAKQVGNRHENDEEFSSELKGYPWQKACEGLPTHEGFVLVAIKDDSGEFKMQMCYFRIEGEKRYFATTSDGMVGPYDHSAKIRVTDNLYWRYIGAPNF